MRPRLINPSREKPAHPERRRSDRGERRRGAERFRRGGVERDAVAQQEQAAPEPRQALELPAGAHLRTGFCDPDAEKVRRAGGPRDEAVYTCSCGYFFSAPVSTTVSCPHCGCGQAW